MSIQDEMENVFVWEHLQAYEGLSKGAWLGMTFNPKGTKEGMRFEIPLGTSMNSHQVCGEQRKPLVVAPVRRTHTIV